jgi:phosphoribosylaminoimidazole carboxylase (NCAIR synthetase)
LINEIAPRPHNSGHYTIEACNTSQFEQHLRAILGLPLGDTDLKVQVAGMINILGTGDNEYDKTMDPLNRAMAIKVLLVILFCYQQYLITNDMRTNRELQYIGTARMLSRLQERWAT